MKTKPIFLDCTLRDGGYYNGWDFTNESVICLVDSLNKAGANIIELGYKSPGNRKSVTFEGLYRYCVEESLAFLKPYDKGQFCFMIDVKDFMVDDEIDYKALEVAVKPATIRYLNGLV